MSELLPCPFCGSEPTQFEDDEIQCSNRQCLIRPSTGRYGSAERWNTRTPSDAAVELLAKEIAANFIVDINDLTQTTEFIAAIITKHLAARTGEGK